VLSYPHRAATGVFSAWFSRSNAVRSKPFHPLKNDDLRFGAGHTSKVPVWPKWQRQLPRKETITCSNRVAGFSHHEAEKSNIERKSCIGLYRVG